MSGLTLVTGGTGKTGRRLAAQLEAKGFATRVASRKGEPAFDWSEPEGWDAALEGVSSVYLVAPSGLGYAIPAMADFLGKAVQRGVARFVLLSASALPAGGPAHGQVHQWLKDHCNDWTVLRPTAFMQNFSEGPFAASIRDEDAIYSNTGSGRVGFIDAGDIASCAFAALTSPKAINSDFILTGGETLSYDEAAERIGEACGRRVVHKPVSNAEMAERFVKRGMPGPAAQMLAAGYQLIATGAEDRTTDAVAALTGRPPVTFDAFARDNAEAWRR